MRVIDADGHVEENLDTFSDKYLDPAFRALRPRVTAVDGLVYWVIDEQLYPRRVGPGCHNLGTPTNFNGQLAAHTQGKTDSIGSMELSDLTARLTAMDEEDIAIQVIYTTLFLAYPLTKNVGLGSAITDILQPLDGRPSCRPPAHQMVGGGQSGRRRRGSRTGARSQETRRGVGHGARNRRRRYARSSEALSFLPGAV